MYSTQSVPQSSREKERRYARERENARLQRRLEAIKKGQGRSNLSNQNCNSAIQVRRSNILVSSENNLIHQIVHFKPVSSKKLAEGIWQKVLATT